MKKALIFFFASVSFNLANSQNVGIGTPTPGYSLHILKSTGESSVGVNATGTATVSLLNLSIDDRIDGNSLALLKYRVGVAGNASGIPRSNLSAIVADAGAGALLIGTNQASPVYFTTDNAQRMRITEDGKIGINQPATPLALFEVQGRSDVLVTANFVDISLAGKRAAITGTIKTNTGASCGICGATYESAGGAVSPIELVTYGVLGQSGDNGYAVGGYSIGATALRGRSNTGKALHTSGALKFDGVGEGAGKVMTSDAAGNATWQSLPASAGTWGVNGNNIYNTNSGRVGIGTAIPSVQNKLHVHESTSPDASIGISNSTTTDGVNRGARLRMVNSDFNIINNEETGNLNFQTAGFSRMSINSNGNVGIGISAIDPNASLHIKFPSSGGILQRLLLESPDLNQGFGIQFKNPNGVWTMGTNIGNFNDDRFNLYYNGGVALHTLVISSTGNLGVGNYTAISTPTERLEIKDGYLKVSGSPRTAFKVTATGGFNIVANQVKLNYPSMAQSDILIVTHNFSNTYVGAVGTWWNGTEWRIFREDQLAMPNGEVFNVMVIKQ